MIKYKCGHKSKGMLIIENSSDTFANYLVWKDSTGFDGDKTECFDCYVRRISSPSDNNDFKKVCEHKNTSFDYNNNIFCVDCKKYEWEWNKNVHKPIPKS